MCWIDFHNGIWGCGLLCTLLISFYFFYFTANTPRATTPHLYITGYHAEGYHAPSIPHGLPRLYHHCTAITPVYIPATTPRATTPHIYHQGLSRSTTHVHRVITPAISNSYFVVLHFTGFYATSSNLLTLAHTARTHPTAATHLHTVYTPHSIVRAKPSA